MKKKVLALLCAAFAAFFCMGLVGCAETKLELDRGSVSLGRFEETVLTVTGADAADVTWTSSDEAVVVVTGGTLSPRGTGKAVVTASAGKASATCDVTVLEVSETPVLTVSPLNVELSVGRTQNLSASLSLAGKSVQGGVSYASHDETVASVTESGVISAVGKGETKIEVSAVYMGYETEELVSVTVKPDIHVLLSESELELAASAQEGHVNEKRVTATVTEQGKPVEGAKVEWKSDNEAVVSVTADGLITAKSVGTATVSAAYSAEDGGDVATVAVTVYRPVIELGGATYDVSEEKPDLALVGAEAAFSEVLGIYDITSEKTEITFEDAEGGVKLVSSSMKMGERRYSVVLAGVEYRFDALVQRVIRTAEEFKNLESYLEVSADGKTSSGYFVLGADIRFGAQDNFDVIGTWSDDDGGYFSKSFNGVFDGRGHVIYDFRLDGNQVTYGNGGIFMEIGERGVFKNVAFIDAYVNTSSAIITTNLKGTIENVFVHGEIGSSAAGWAWNALIAGRLGSDKSLVKNCIAYVKNDISSVQYASGAVGHLGSGKIDNLQNVYAIGTERAVGQASDKPGSSVTGVNAAGYLTIEAFKEGVKDVSAFGGDFWKNCDGFPVAVSVVSHVEEVLGGLAGDAEILVGTTAFADRIEDEFTAAWLSFSLKEEVDGVTVTAAGEIVIENTVADGAKFTLVVKSALTGTVAEVNYTVSAPIDLTDTLFATVDLSEEFTALDFASFGIEGAIVSVADINGRALALTERDGQKGLAMAEAEKLALGENKLVVKTDEKEYIVKVNVLPKLSVKVFDANSAESVATLGYGWGYDANHKSLSYDPGKSYDGGDPLMADEGAGSIKVVATGAGELALKITSPLINDVSAYDGLFFYVYTDAANAMAGTWWFGDTSLTAGQWTKIKLPFLSAGGELNPITDENGNKIYERGANGFIFRIMNPAADSAFWISSLYAYSERETVVPENQIFTANSEDSVGNITGAYGYTTSFSSLGYDATKSYAGSDPLMANEGVGSMKIVAVGGEIALKTKTANIADVSGYDGLFFYVYTEAESAMAGTWWSGDTPLTAGQWTKITLPFRNAEGGLNNITNEAGKYVYEVGAGEFIYRIMGAQGGDVFWITSLYGYND